MPDHGYLEGEKKLFSTATKNYKDKPIYAFLYNNLYLKE